MLERSRKHVVAPKRPAASAAAIGGLSDGEADLLRVLRGTADVGTRARVDRMAGGERAALLSSLRAKGRL